MGLYTYAYYLDMATMINQCFLVLDCQLFPNLSLLEMMLTIF